MYSNTIKPERDQQIAKAIHTEVSVILECADDPRINELEIRSVIPKKGGRYFIILFGPPPNAYDTSDAIGAKEAQRLLERARSYFRGEIAESLNLKRCPELSFQPDPIAWSDIAREI